MSDWVTAEVEVRKDETGTTYRLENVRLRFRTDGSVHLELRDRHYGIGRAFQPPNGTDVDLYPVELEQY